MKKLVLALVAISALAACKKDETVVVPVEQPAVEATPTEGAPAPTEGAPATEQPASH